MKKLRTSLLDIAFESGGPLDGRPILLLHGWPDDATAWRDVGRSLARAGFRWVAPWLRGFGQTRFLEPQTPRDGTGVAIATDALELADALGWDRFAVAGHDWGGRAAYILAAVAPERVTSIASLAISYTPHGRFITPSFEQSRRWWYQWFMTTEGGASAVRDNPAGFARLQWDSWGPTRWFDDATFELVAGSFRNPDWAAITLHGYRSRWRPEALDPRYAKQRSIVEATEILHVPTLMIQGRADECDPPAESENQDRFFSKSYSRVVLDGVGHFPARESAEVVAEHLLAHLEPGRAASKRKQLNATPFATSLQP